MQGTKQRGFPWYLTDTVVAAIVAAENGLLVSTDPVAAVVGGLGVLDERSRFQHKQTDYEFLRQIANQHGIDLWVDGERLHFELLRPGEPASDLELRWGASLIDFTPRRTSIGQIAAVNVRLWVEGLKTQLAVSVGWDGQRLTASVSIGIGQVADPVEATLELPDFPLETPVDAIRWAVGELRRRVNTQLTGQGSAIGDPRFRAGRVIALHGLGRRLSGGNFRLTSVSHSLDGGGYRTRFQVRKEVV
jgi:phage protein D